MAVRQGLRARLIRVYGFSRKELFSVFRQPRLLLTLIVAPFLILLVFGLGYRQDPPPFRTLLVLGNEEAQLAADREDLDEAFGASIDLLGTSTDAVDARRQLAAGDLDLLIIAPEDPMSALDAGERALFTVVHGEVDPVMTAAIDLVARSSIDEINRRVLSDVVSTAQTESEDLDVVLGDLQEGSSVLVTALENGDRGAASQTSQQLRADLGQVQTGSGQTESLYSSISRSLGGSQGGVDSPLGESLDRAQSDDPETALEGARDFESQVTELREQIGTAQGLDPEVLVSPFAVEVEQINETPAAVSVFYAPATVVVLIQHLAITFAALSLVRERQLGLTEVFRASPLGPSEAVAGKYLGFGLLAVLVAAALTAVMLAFGVTVGGFWLTYVLVIVLLILTSLGLGFVISGIARTDSQAVQYVMIALLLTIFFTGFVLPLDQLAAPVHVISYLVPVTYGIQALHDILFRGVPADPMILAGLGAYALITVVGAWLVVRRDVASVARV